MKDKICFVNTEINGEKVLVCAHERDYDGKGSYIARKASDFEGKQLEKKVEIMIDMIVALLNHVEVKDNVKFSDYQRQLQENKNG